jgi:hypothetical protein
MFRSQSENTMMAERGALLFELDLSLERPTHAREVLDLVCRDPSIHRLSAVS